MGSLLDRLSSMQLSLEGIERALPHYLSAERRVGVRKALAEFPEIRFFYLDAHRSSVLQGDCWSRLVVFNFFDGSRKSIRGMLLSNSCDMDASNKSIMTPQITFCPLISLARLVTRWTQAGVKEQQILDTVAAIKRQEISNFIYLPVGASITEDTVAYLDDVHTMPQTAFAADNERSKLATLSDAGFYLFLFKLSVHFCRMHEDVDRSAAAAT